MADDNGRGEESDPVALDIEQAVAELLKDAGPVLAHHVQHWSAARVPGNMSEDLRCLFGQVCHNLLSSLIPLEYNSLECHMRIPHAYMRQVCA